MNTRWRPWSADRSTLTMGVSIAAVVLCFILAIPRSGGPDEPSHMVASAALVRGERAGDPVEWDAAFRSFVVPAMVGEPNPVCWALQPDVPAGCAHLLDDRTDDVIAVTTAANYPPWTYVLPGAASFVPWAAGYAYLARMAMATIPFVLLVAALHRARTIGRAATVAIMVGLTPIVWFSMSIVNPSAVAITGGLALWVALLVPRPRGPDVLLVAGAAGVLLARRDGPVWATLIVLAVCVGLGRRPSRLVASQPRSVHAALALLAIVPVVTVLLQGFRDLNVALACAPLGLVAVDASAANQHRLTRRSHRIAFVIGVSAAVCAAVVAAAAQRPGGLDGSVIMLIVTNTGDHLTQLVGVLGWLDAPVPTSAVFAFWAVLGGLITIAALEQPRIALAGGLAFGATILTAWLLEFGQGANYGSYWQGRYSMPFVIGIPLLLASRTPRPPGRAVVGSRAVAQLAVPLVAVTWVILNLGFAAALHRWGVGVDGTWSPTAWNTWGAPIAPVVLLAVHAVASATLLLAALQHRTLVTAGSGLTDVTDPATEPAAGALR